MTDSEMTAYYAKRAFEYERIYQKPERQDDLRTLQSIIADSFSAHDLLEIACGTGYWTQFASKSAKSILGTDCNEEVLEIARKKDYGGCPIRFTIADAYSLDNIDGPFSGALVGFWWSHVPNSMIPNFLNILHSKLGKGAMLIMLDNRYVEGSSTQISRTDNEGNTYQMRNLDDGSTHEVLKNFPGRNEIVSCIEPLSEDCEFMELDYFWLVRYKIK